MEQAEEALNDKLSLLKLRMRMYLVSHLNIGNVDQHEAKMKEREQVFEDIHLVSGKLIQKFSSQLSQERSNQLENQTSLLEQEFLVYRESFASKLIELKNNILSMNIQPSLEVPSMGNLTLSDTFRAQQNAAKRKVKTKLEAVMEDLVTLSNKVCEVEDWSSASDLSVGRAMKENDKLRKEFTRIHTVRRDIDELMAEFDLEEVRDGLSVQECDIKLYEVREEVEHTIKAVVEQDNVRELYSLDEAKVDKIKLPTFGGKESEDYEKFKNDLLKGFAQNRVTQADKLAKLRECLYGDAKRLVPQSISSNADDALKVLDQAYGDPMRLFKYRREHFFKLGKQPEETDKSGYKSQVEWLRDAEVALQSLYALALKDKTCAAQLFSPGEMILLVNMFNSRKFMKLVKCEGFGESRFKRWLVMVGEFREKAQKLASASDRSLDDPKVLINVGKCTNRNQSFKAAQPSPEMFKLPR